MLDAKERRGSHTVKPGTINHGRILPIRSPTDLGIVSTSILTHSGGVVTTKVRLFPKIR